MELAFPEEKIISMRKSMAAMQSLGGLKSGNDLEKIYAFYKKYFFDQAQEYFPWTVIMLMLSIVMKMVN